MRPPGQPTPILVPAIATAAVLLLNLGAACGGPAAPPGSVCGEIFSPGGSSGLTDALEKAAPGDCVVLGNSTYRGGFRLPAGVQLLAGEDKLPRLEAEGTEAPVLRIDGGEGTRVVGLTIVATGGQGIDLRDGPASLEQLEVTAPEDIAVYLGCPTAGCSAGAAVDLLDSQLHGSEIGLWVDGLLATTSGLTLADNIASGVIEGYGVIVTGGGRLESNDDRVTGNGGIGVLADGAETTAELLDIEVSGNDGPGIWTQGLRGSAASPALVIDGPTSMVSENAKAGLGSIDTVGIVMGTCIVRGTLPVPWPQGGGTVFQVGDGVALLAGTSQVELGAEVALSGNDRAQLMVDQGGTMIVMGTAIVEPGDGRYGVVIQNTTNSVDLPSGVTPDTTNGNLGVDDGMQATP